MQNERPQGHKYIYDQSKLRCVPYGRRDSDYCGCGWIAVYNALLALGVPESGQRVRDELNRGGLFLGGRLGTNPLAIKRFFKLRGYLCRWSLFWKRAVIKGLDGGLGGGRGKYGGDDEQSGGQSFLAIVFYFHRHGAHFLLLRPREGGFLAYNDRYGEKNDMINKSGLKKRFGALSMALIIAERPEFT